MPNVDPITVEVIHNYLLSSAREMNRNLVRTSYNTIIYEVHDFGLALYDRKLRMMAEAPGLAVFTRGNDYALHKMVDSQSFASKCVAMGCDAQRSKSPAEFREFVLSERQKWKKVLTTARIEPR